MATETRSFPFVRGTVAGLSAYFAGYLVTYLAVSPQLDSLLPIRAFEFFTGENPVWKLVGWVFYNAHFVDTNLPGLVETNAVNFLSLSEDPAANLLYAIPIVLLVVAGAIPIIGRKRTSVGQDISGGASVTLGYLTPAVLGAQLFSISLGNVTARPDILTATLLAGLLYPLLFGSIGGVLAGRYNSRQTISPQ